MSIARSHPFIVVALVALFLYWIVQDPNGAAVMIRDVFEWIIELLQLIADRVVLFLNALT